MAREAERPDHKKQAPRDSTKPGTIVAGPEAHARERSGKAPSKRDGREKEDHTNDPEDRS